MPLITSHDPCIFGPDIAGLSPPLRLWALVPDHEHTGNPSQACDCFAAGLPRATVVLMPPDIAIKAFTIMASKILECRHQIDQAGASVMLALWRLPNDAVMLGTVDLEGSFAADHMAAVLDGLSYPAPRSHTITSAAFDAVQARTSPDISAELAYALKFFST